jgi:hypothetical protein
LNIDNLNTKTEAMEDAVESVVDRSMLIGGVSGLILLNGILYPKFLKMGRSIMGNPSKSCF